MSKQVPIILEQVSLVVDEQMGDSDIMFTMEYEPGEDIATVYVDNKIMFTAEWSSALRPMLERLLILWPSKE